MLGLGKGVAMGYFIDAGIHRLFHVKVSYE
jgi:hypothetical protein